MTPGSHNFGDAYICDTIGDGVENVDGKIRAGTTGDMTFVAHWSGGPDPDDPVDPDDTVVPEDINNTPDTSDKIVVNVGALTVGVLLILGIIKISRYGRRTN